jgi:hypothetical protein
MSTPRYEIILFIFLVAAIILGLSAHLVYLWRIKNNVRRTSDRSFQEEDLKTSLRIYQGSNFNTIMLFSWNLFLVAFIFLYFLTPMVFSGWNYFRLPQIASNSFGLAILGIIVILILGIVVSIYIPRIYGYYLIPRLMKKLSLLAPLLLIISLLCSINLGTVYPIVDSLYWNVGYAAILVSVLLLFMPIIKGFLEELRI